MQDNLHPLDLGVDCVWCVCVVYLHGQDGDGWRFSFYVAVKGFFSKKSPLLPSKMVSDVPWREGGGFAFKTVVYSSVLHFDLEITFDGDRISGCRLQNYLLEKSRVVYQVRRGQFTTVGTLMMTSWWFLSCFLNCKVCDDHKV